MTKLRVAITVDPYIPVPPRQYGGIERVVDLVARGLVAKGHSVLLFAHPDSRSAGALVPYGAPPHLGWRSRVSELFQVGQKLWRLRGEIDVILSWGRLAALLPVLPQRRLPKMQRYCRQPVPWRSVRTAVGLAGSSLCFTGPSNSVYRHRSTMGHFGGEWETIYDGVEVSKYTFVGAVPSDAPLVFLGQLDPIKGVHLAIDIAKAAHRRLVIAGNQAKSGPGPRYFERSIRPHLDGSSVEYVGPVDDAQKNLLLGQAAALLFTSVCEETFGLVMAEAMACGTPVIGFDRGSVPEVIRNGSNGFVCRDVSEAITAVSRISELERRAIRADCETRLNAPRIVDAFERLMCRMVARCARNGSAVPAA